MTGPKKAVVRDCSIDLSALAEPFPAEDIEWRVSQAGTNSNGVFCMVLAYITARAIQERLDAVCGPANWRNEHPVAQDWGKHPAIVGGISIRVGDEWITKWDVSDPTHIEAVKGGFSGAMKRAGAQWGIGRYLYHLPTAFAEISEKKQVGYEYARLPQDKGGAVFFWKPPALPDWALPKDADRKITPKELNDLKKAWRAKFGEGKSTKEMQEGFTAFVFRLLGEFPLQDPASWTKDSLDRCHDLIEKTTEADGVSASVPFDGEDE